MGGGSWVGEPWHTILYDRYVHILYQMADEFDAKYRVQHAMVKVIFTDADYVGIFSFVQFVLRHPRCPFALDEEVKRVLKRARAAYTVLDRDTIFPIATPEEGKAIEKAFADLDAHELNGARAHLRAAGELINKGDFAGSVRESIHAVEAVARVLDPKASSGLAPALAALEKKGAIHGGLKAGFGSIYGYTSDAKGVRHSLVDEPKATVDQHDAVFMLGACASFTTYLIGKATDAGISLSKE